MIAKAVATKFCSRCENTYPATHEHFHSNAWRPDGLGIYCRKCQREIVRAGYQRRMERLRASPSEYAKYKAKNNRREQKYRRRHPEKYQEQLRRAKIRKFERKLKLKMVKR